MTWSKHLSDYIEGFLLAFDFHPSCDRKLYERDDEKALDGDWHKVCEDMWRAVKCYRIMDQ